ncbi:MAG: hypothetical protein J0H87_08985, partial [Holosporales bacterium]|nr:hypothetical protein [Holosporales bacterium]
MEKCLVVGEDELTLQCADFLLKMGFGITFISPVLQIQAWCRDKDISCYENIQEVLELDGYDYLFSIVNSSIVPNSLLKKIKKLAINYHDSLLPKFAGVNATPWTLLSGSHEHGITWHIITERPDEGDIILQKRFSLKPEDTTLSVRTTCKNLAVRTFPILVKQLMENSFTLTPQDLQNRTYYGFSKKPYGNALISWKSSASDILILHKALTFGNIINVLALPKFVVKDNIYIPLYVEDTHEQSKENPGTITKIRETHISISTATNDLLMSDLVTIEGKKVSLSDFIRDNEIKVGDFLLSPTKEFLMKFQELSEKASLLERKYLSFNKANFLANEKTFFPHPNLNSNSQCSDFFHIEQISPDLIKIVENLVGDSPKVDEIILILSFLYLYQINNVSFFPNFFHISSFVIPKEYTDFFSQTAPLHLEVAHDELFSKALKQGVKQVHFLKNHYYLKDMSLRYPDYYEIGDSIYRVNFFFSKESQSPQKNALNITIDPRSLKIKFALSVDEQARDFFTSIIKNFSNWLNSIEEQETNLKTIKLSEIQLIGKLQCSYIQQNDQGFSGTIIEVIDGIVERKPNNIALKHGEKALTYRELLRQANQLSYFLR